MSKESHSSESSNQGSGSESESTQITAPVDDRYVYVEPNGVLIPGLDLSNIRGYIKPRTEITLPTIQEQFATQEARFLSLKQKALAADNQERMIMPFALAAVEFASSTLGLMQAITGNEQDSHAERIRKERIPSKIRGSVMREAKDLQTEFVNLSSSYHNALTEKDESVPPLDIHLNFAKIFLDLGSRFYDTAKEMQKNVDDALLAKQKPRNRHTRVESDVETCIIL